jgi:hypothetical protein
MKIGPAGAEISIADGQTYDEANIRFFAFLRKKRLKSFIKSGNLPTEITNSGQR